MILGIGALAISTAINYLIVYMPTYAVKALNLPPTVGFAATFAAGIAPTFLTPIAGMISDKVGRTTCSRCQPVCTGCNQKNVRSLVRRAEER